jgi:hypothetical protein
VKREVQLVHEAPPDLAGLGPLPVRVRTRTGEIVGSGVTGLPITVPAGSYYVTMLMPDGREVGLDHKVRAGAPAEAGAGERAAPPLAMPAAAAAPELLSADPAPATMAAIWRGDWFGAWAGQVPDLSGSGAADIALSSADPAILPLETGHDRVLVLPLNGRYRCTIIPYDECVICIDESARARAIAARLSGSGDEPLVEYRSVVSEETNALLGFVESGILTNMVAVTEDEVRRGEEAISGSRASVLRAITGAYVLLRANALEGLERWLGQLDPFQASLPDLLPLRAELCARSGHHERAVEVMADALERGRCPWFRAGLSYMLERLRLYVDVTDNSRADFNLTGDDYQRFVIARDTLERMLPTMLTSRYIATFDVPRST